MLRELLLAGTVFTLLAIGAGKLFLYLDRRNARRTL